MRYYLLLFSFLLACKPDEVVKNAAIRVSDSVQTKDYTNTDDSLIKFDAPAFNDYPVKDTYDGTMAKAKLYPCTYARRYRTAIRETYQAEKVNFAGHYCFVYWGCGSPCQMAAIVDATTGMVYDAPPASLGYDFYPSSNLLIINPAHAHITFNNNKEGYYLSHCPYCKPEAWVWKEKSKKFIQIK